MTRSILPACLVSLIFCAAAQADPNPNCTTIYYLPEELLYYSSAESGAGGPNVDTDSITFTPGAEGTFTMESSASKGAVSSKATFRTDVDDNVIVLQVFANVTVGSGADPNACAIVKSDPNDFGIAFERDTNFLEPLNADVEVSVYTNIWPGGGTGTLNAQMLDLSTTDLNGAPVREMKQETFTVSRGDPVPIGSMISSMAFDLTLDGEGSVNASVILVARTLCQVNNPGGGINGGPGIPGKLGPTTSPPIIHVPVEPVFVPTPPAPKTERIFSPPFVNPKRDYPWKPASYISIHNGLVFQDIHVLRTWAGGVPSIDLKLFARQEPNRLYRTNYEWYLWAPCTGTGVAPDYASVFDPGMTRAPTHPDWATYRFEMDANDYECVTKTDWNLTYPSDGVFVMKNVNGTTMRFERDSCTGTDEVLYQVKEISDRQGRVTRLEYDPNNGALATITDPWGKVVELDNDGNANPLYTKVTDPAGEEYTLGYTTDSGTGKELCTLTDPEGYETKFLYTQDGGTYSYKIEMEVDRAGNLFGITQASAPSGAHRTLNAYPSFGGSFSSPGTAEVVRSISGPQHAFDLEEEDVGGYTWIKVWSVDLEETDGEGHTRTYHRDGDGLIASVSEPNSDPNDASTVWVGAYDSDNNLTMAIDGGNPMNYTWDDDLLVTEATLVEPLGKWTYEYDHPDRATSFDLRNCVTEITKPGGDDATFTYYDDSDGTKRGLVEQATMFDGSVWNFDYTYYADDYGLDPNDPDLPGRLKSATITEPDGVVVKREFDADGHLTAVTRTQNSVEISRTEYSNYTLLGLPGKKTVVRSLTESIVTDLAYDKLGRVTSTTIDPNGLALTTSYEYDGLGQITKVTAATGTVAEMEYDHRNRLNLANVDPNGFDLETSLIYNADDRVHTITDPKSNVTTFSYVDPRGRLTRVEDAEGYYTDYEYDDGAGFSFGRNWKLVEKMTRGFTAGDDPNAFSVVYDYDGLHRLQHKTVEGGSNDDLVTFYDYNSNPNCLCGHGTAGNSLIHKIVDPTGSHTYLYYDEMDRLEKLVKKGVSNADDGGTPSEDAIWEIERDGNGRITKITDPDGIEVTRDYDWDNFTIATQIDPNGVDLQTTVTLDKAGNVVGFEDMNGHDYAMAYDAANRLDEITDSLGDIVSYGYDEVGRVTAMTNGESETWTYIRDAIGRVKEIKDPIVEGGTDKKTTFDYDANGNVTVKIDNEGRRTTYDYDDIDRLIEMIRDEGGGGINAKTTYEHNGLGLLKELTDPANESTVYGYDIAGRLKSITYPDSGAVTFGFGDWVSNRKLTRTDQRSITTSYVFNKLHQLDSRTYSSSDPNELFTWTKAGRLDTAWRDGIADTDYDYDAVGRITLQTQDLDLAGSTPLAGAYQICATYTVNRGSGVDERVVTYADPNGDPVGFSATHSWDARGRLGSISETGAGTFATFGYDLANRITSRALGNNIESAFTYDDNGRIDSLVHEISGGATLFDHSFGYDAVGNRLWNKNNLGGATTLSELYGYDNLDRLTSFGRGELNGAKDAIITDPPTGLLKEHTWTNLDKLGNWISRTSTISGASQRTETRVANEVNEYTQRQVDSDPAISMTYDAAGNLTDDDTYTYYYDAENRLIQVKEDTTVLLDIEYDALGRAIKRTAGSNAIYYIYDAPVDGGPNGYAVVQELDPNGVLLREFVHEDAHTHPVAMIDYTAAGASGAGVAETFYYLYDERGSVVSIADVNDVVVESYRYDPYGGAYVYNSAGTLIAAWNDPNSWDETAITLSAYGNPYGFTGHRFSVVGLYETPFRAYSPSLGRWLQRDPLEYIDSTNLYEYCISSPVNFRDIWGLEILIEYPDNYPGGGDAAEKQIREMIEKLKKHPKLKILIEELEKSPHKHHIGPRWKGSPGHNSIFPPDDESIRPTTPEGRQRFEDSTTPGKGTDTWTGFDPSTGGKSKSGQWMIPSEVLAHELGHAYTNDNGITKKGKRNRNAPPRCEEQALGVQNWARELDNRPPLFEYGPWDAIPDPPELPQGPKDSNKDKGDSEDPPPDNQGGGGSSGGGGGGSGGGDNGHHGGGLKT